MKLRVCFKDHYPCRAETCGEYDACKVRLAKEEQTNEEWFCQLPTEEKADFLAKKCCEISCKFFLGEAEEIFSGYWVEWLKQPHKE